MSERFNPSSEEYKRVEDLPTSEQKHFENVSGGFVKKEAIETEESAALEAIKAAIHDTVISPEDVLRVWAEREDYVRDKIKEGYKSENLSNAEIARVGDDKKLMLELVKQDGGNLQFASERLKNDTEVVLEAVRQSPQAIPFASLELLKKLGRRFNGITRDSGGEIDPEKKMEIVIRRLGDMADVKTFDELYELFKSSSRSLFPDATISNLRLLIESVRRGQVPIDSVSSTFGLRKKVRELKDNESNR